MLKVSMSGTCYSYLLKYGINENRLPCLGASNDVAVCAAGFIIELPDKHPIGHCA